MEHRNKMVTTIRIDNQGREAFKRSVVDKTVDLPTSNDHFQVFYHGTNHASAENITECGIKLEGKSRRGLDFSDGNGFYVGDNFIDSLDQASLTDGYGEAVIVYRVDARQLWEEMNGLDLRNNLEEWRRVVTEYRKSNLARRGRGESPDYDYRRKLAKFDFITGPWSKLRDRRYEPIETNSHQLCVRSGRCAELFRQSLHSVVFFE